MSGYFIYQVLIKPNKLYQFNHFPKILTSKLQRTRLAKYLLCSKADQNGSQKNLGQTTVIIQDGANVHELPTIVRKSTFSLPIETEIVIEPEYKSVEVAEIILGFQRCEKVERLFMLIDLIPEDEIAPVIAIHAIKRLLELEAREKSEEHDPQTRKILVNKLIDKICVKHHMSDVLEMLELIKNDPLLERDDSHLSRLCDHIMILNNEGQFTIKQISQIINHFKTLKKYPNIVDYIDKLWPGIIANEKSLDVDSFKTVFSFLPMFKQSRKFVQNMLDKKLQDLWWKLNQDEVCDILNKMLKNEHYNPRTLSMISRWTKMNINLINEESLHSIVNSFIELDHCEPGLESILEQYVKARSQKFHSMQMLSTILEYCGKFRLRICTILESSAENFMSHSHIMTPEEATKVMNAFGILYFSPPKPSQFWKIFEEYIEHHLFQFAPLDLIDIFLSCIYVNKHPINFMEHIFSPTFLDNVWKSTNELSLNNVRSKLKFLDTAMTLECPASRGPYLSRDYSAKSLYVDNRVRRWVNQLHPIIERIVYQGKQQVITFLTLPQLPTIEEYVLDLVVYPQAYGQLTFMNKVNIDRKRCVGILLHPNEHYTDDGQLIGPQQARGRHFRCVGIKIIDLSLNELKRVRSDGPEALQTYLTSTIEMASLQLV